MAGKVVVVRPGALGDTILTLPALSAIRTTFPRSQLIFIGNPSALEIVDAGLADEKISIDDPSIGELFEPYPVGHVPYPAGHVPSHDLRSRFGDAELAVLWLRNSAIMAENFRILGARKTIAAPSQPPVEPRIHATDYLLTTVAAAIAAFEQYMASSPAITLQPEQIAFGRKFHMEKRLGANTVAIHPGSGGRRKCWAAERFATIGNSLVRWGYSVVVVAGPADEEVVAACTEAMREVPPIVGQRLSVGELAGVLKQCSGFVGNDSGVSHLAGALGVPTVAIYGATDAQVWGVRGRRVELVSGSSLKSITVETVLAAFGQVVEGEVN